MPEVPMVASAVLLLLQVPPAVKSESVVVPDAHTDVLPVIGLGDTLTVTTLSAEQVSGVIPV